VANVGARLSPTAAPVDAHALARDCRRVALFARTGISHGHRLGASVAPMATWRVLATALCLSSFLAGCRGSRSSPLLEAAQSCLHEGDLSCPRPILNVRSLRDSQAYFRDKLGFKIDWDHGEPPTFGSVSRGHSVLFMCQGCQGGGGAWVMLFAADVDKLYAELRSKHAFIKTPPTTMPWGLRELHVADLDGNILRIAAPTDH